MTTVNTERNFPLGTFTNNRKDNWWIMPLLQGLIIIIFVAYTTVTLFFPDIYGDGSCSTVAGCNYHSPIFDLSVTTPLAKAIGWPTNPLLPAALLVLWIPIGYRATCYYMRRIYYRSFFGNPPACATNGYNIRRGKYTGERWFPFILNNFHRYFLYLAIVIALFHWYELTDAFNMGSNGNFVFGIGLGTILLVLDTVLLSFYVLSCHAFRHLIGGGTECFSCSGVKTVQYKGWKIVSKLNEYHGTFFWLSLISVMVADFYIRLLAGNFGIQIKDIVFFHL